jgi:peptidoglycan/LPS O-acetylase OafA/YrhL
MSRGDIDLKPINLGGMNSVFLDLLRLSCACVVLFYHAIILMRDQSIVIEADSWFAAGKLMWVVAHRGAHWAVIVFFVLSGYVIAHVTAKPGTFSGYISARFSRLYSVLIPALLVTALVELIVRVFTPDLLSEFIGGIASIPRYIITLFLGNELWFLNAGPKFNSPLWSLSFELWYYLIFGLWFYRRQLKGGVWLALIACAIAGPKILLLMPCWIAGVVAYEISRRFESIPFRSLGTSALIIALSFILQRYTGGWPGEAGDHTPWFFSAQFLTDWISAAIVALALVMLPSRSSVPKSGPAHRLVRNLGDLTYPIYAFHQPILVSLVAVLPLFFDVPVLNFSILIGVTILITIILGRLAEGTRGYWRQMFSAVIDRTRKYW